MEYNPKKTHGARKHAWRTQAAWANKMEDNQKNLNPTQLTPFGILQQLLTGTELERIPIL